MGDSLAGAVPYLRDAAIGQVSSHQPFTPTTLSRQAAMAGPDRKSNLRTALILLSIAAVFFAGVIANRMLFGP